MKDEMSFRDKLIKKFFNITGNFDEYKRQQANRIGTNAFMVCLPALLIGPIVAGIWAVRDPRAALTGLMLFDIILVSLIILPYLMGASQRAHLTDHEIWAEQLPAARHHIIVATIGTILYAGLGFYLIQVLTDVIFDGASLIGQLTSVTIIQKSIICGLLVGVTMGIVALIRLKKQSH